MRAIGIILVVLGTCALGYASFGNAASGDMFNPWPPMSDQKNETVRKGLMGGGIILVIGLILLASATRPRSTDWNRRSVGCAN